MIAAPTDEPVQFDATNVFRIEDDEVDENWAVGAAVASMGQLGIAPDGPPE